MNATGKKFEAVTIKGTAGGLLCRLLDDESIEFSDVLAELSDRLSAGEKFFRKGRFSVELGNRSLEKDDFDSLLEIFNRFDISIEAIISGVQSTRSQAKLAGIPYNLPNNQNTRPALVAEGSGDKNGPRGGVHPFDTAEAYFIRRTVRSGQVIKHHTDVVVLGDVNAGAQIIAGGSVIVWGTVRGRIDAGQNGDGEGAVICALSLKPTQLGIHNVVAMGNTETLNDPEAGPEMASLQDGTIVLDSWMPRRGRLRG
ncbi:MAG: septum site-determining protein MinC [Chloroflexi bacterium]|nr:septum site-determining protein MinC [Chloroflexota bacterium]OJV88790.1 MAG: septum site-determining protein MinC [Chloroflexi bacterium 54-19]